MKKWKKRGNTGEKRGELEVQGRLSQRPVEGRVALFEIFELFFHHKAIEQLRSSSQPMATTCNGVKAAVNRSGAIGNVQHLKLIKYH